MTRAELIDKMASQGPLSHKQADVVVETILDAMKGAISQGDRIEIRGFGVFSLRLRRPRRARNPRTGEPLVSFERLVRMMVDEDIRLLKNKLTSSVTDIPMVRAA